MRVVLLGMNHRTAPLEVRERFAVEDPTPALRKLCAADEIEEAVIVSTCNRVELIALSRQPEAAKLKLRSFFVRELRRDPSAAPDALGESLDDYLYELESGEAMGHVLRVTSSIDSMVVGEPQILGQMKDAWRAAVAAGTCGPVLSRLFQHAFATAKRVKNETAIARRPVSVARVALDLASQIFESFEDKNALLIGAGEMIEAALEALRGAGLAKVRVCNRTRSRAEALAERFGATPHGLDEIDQLLPSCDVVLSCIGGGVILDRARVERALVHRGARPLFLIDLGVPRNVDPDVNELDDAFLYDVDDLQGVAASNAEERRRETLRAEEIVREEREHMDGWLAALQAVPAIRQLTTRAEEIRAREVARTLARLGLDDRGRELVEALSRSLVGKLLHEPVSRLRAARDREEGIAMLEAAQRLFGLDANASPDASDWPGDDEDSPRSEPPDGES